MLALSAPLGSTLTLAAEILILAGLYVGFYFARHKKFRPHHFYTQTTMVLLNLVLILVTMIPSFNRSILRGGASSATDTALTLVHAGLGTVVELLGLYFVLGEGLRVIPRKWRIKKIKRAMRLTLALWTLTVFLGAGIYFYRYQVPSASAAPSTAVPGETFSVSPLLAQADTLRVHADELERAVQRANDPTVRRHTEHVINLLVGRSSPDYGDLDRDGVVEDPGDGTGLLNYLRRVRDQAAAANETDAVSAADAVRVDLDTILNDSRQIMLADDYRSVMTQIQEIFNLSDRVARGTTNSVPQILGSLDATATHPTVQPERPGPGTITVNMQDFAFNPKTLQIKPGTTVVFVNMDNAKHTVTEDNGAYNSGDVLPGKTFSFTFAQAGTFPYFCEYHGDRGGVDMAGTIVVAP